MVDKNLFLYDLAVVAIFKDESPYLREWLDYHLLAGVEHFYLYDNGSSDGYEKILAPYVEANLVTLIDWRGKMMQMPAAQDALRRFRFFCRYMAFIDLDEFISPRTNQSIVELVDEILSTDAKAQAVAVNWLCFGSNGERTADFSRGVLERFTRRAVDDWNENIPDNADILRSGNVYTKPIANPRSVKFLASPHVAIHFGANYSVNDHGERLLDTYANERMTDSKIRVNHYYVKSLEEFTSKANRGSACRPVDKKNMNAFAFYDRNEIFDDWILRYRAARAQNFRLESDAERIRRTEKFLVETLTQCSPFSAPAEFFIDKLETFLTCRKLAELLGTKIGTKSAEEYALVWLHQCFAQKNQFTYAELQLFLSELPEILSRPFPLCRKINLLAQEKIFPVIYADLKREQQWHGFYDFQYIQRLLNLILR